MPLELFSVWNSKLLLMVWIDEDSWGEVRVQMSESEEDTQDTWLWNDVEI